MAHSFFLLDLAFEGPGIPSSAPLLAPRSVSCRPPARGDRAHTVPAGSPPSSPPVGAVRRHVSQNGDRAARAGVLLATTLSPPLRDRRRPRHRRRQHRLAPRASPSPSPPPALDLATASFWGSAGGLPASPPPPQRDRFRSIGEPSPATRSHGDRGPLIASASSQVFDLGRKRRWQRQPAAACTEC